MWRPAAPSGYYGDWTDVEQPGTAGTPLGKRAYYIEITKENDSSVLWLDNRDYNADIAMRYEGGTKLMTSDGTETTVTIGDYKDAGRTYDTDNSGTAANEDSYIMTPKEGVMQNDHVLGEISLSKVDLVLCVMLEVAIRTAMHWPAGRPCGRTAGRRGV